MACRGGLDSTRPQRSSRSDRVAAAPARCDASSCVALVITGGRAYVSLDARPRSRKGAATTRCTRPRADSLVGASSLQLRVARSARAPTGAEAAPSGRSRDGKGAYVAALGAGAALAPQFQAARRWLRRRADGRGYVSTVEATAKSSGMPSRTFASRGSSPASARPPARRARCALGRASPAPPSGSPAPTSGEGGARARGGWGSDSDLSIAAASSLSLHCCLARSLARAPAPMGTYSRASGGRPRRPAPRPQPALGSGGGLAAPAVAGSPRPQGAGQERGWGVGDGGD